MLHLLLLLSASVLAQVFNDQLFFNVSRKSTEAETGQMLKYADKFSSIKCLWSTKGKNIWWTFWNVVFHPLIVYYSKKFPGSRLQKWSWKHFIAVTNIRILRKLKEHNKEKGCIVEQKMIIVQDTYTCPDGWHVSDIGDEVWIIQCLILFLTN